MKSQLPVNDIEMKSMHNEGISVVTERLIKTSVSKNVYIHKLDDIVNKKIIHIIAQLK